MTERVLLVRIEDRDSVEETLEELRGLTETAGGQVVEVLSQKAHKLNPATLVGSGKVEEIASVVTRQKIQSVIFDKELSPAQQKNLEESIPSKILDRTRLILDIFAQRARTREGGLQVELAQLSYLLPRLTGRGVELSQQVGGIGTRGPGERQLEIERRKIRDRIAKLKSEISHIRQQRTLQRQKRLSVPFPTIAIIGYTNVGKSTLLNTLTGEKSKVVADDKLFATLDPTTRRVKLPAGGWALFTDTVGFIQKLPHTLIAAFRATLEEVTQADILLHVRDASSPHALHQKQAVEQVLEELKAEEIPRIDVLNKWDKLNPTEKMSRHKENPQGIPLSASQGTGLDILLNRIEEFLSYKWLKREILLPTTQSRLLNEIYKTSQVLHQKNTNGQYHIQMRITKENYQRLLKLIRS